MADVKHDRFTDSLSLQQPLHKKPKKNCIFFIQSCIFETRRPARVYEPARVRAYHKFESW